VRTPHKQISTVVSRALRIVAIWAAAAFVSASAAQRDTAFDGVWVGTETCAPPGVKVWMPKEGVGSGTWSHAETDKLFDTHPAKIAISDAGTNAGIIDGCKRGRYPDVHRAGSTLILHAGGTNLELRLSNDGEMLTVTGTSTRTIRTGSGRARYSKDVPIKVTGTFHRAGLRRSGH
jgi:hypothetical protein